jgi:hypothetical protein
MVVVQELHGFRYEYKKTAEVYEFYLHDAMQEDKTDNTETKALGELKRAE